MRNSYWTSGSDEYHEGVFSWCAPQKAVNVSMDFKFKPGEPNNNGGSENCLQGSILSDPLPDTFVYDDQGCGKTFRYICEVYLAVFRHFCILFAYVKYRAQLVRVQCPNALHTLAPRTQSK